MEGNKSDTSPNQGLKGGIDSLSRDELIKKYKGVLNLAKKAKQAKDELAVENRSLAEALLRCETQKDADKKALLTMKETLEQFTEQKLQLSVELEDLRQRQRTDDSELIQLRIENESLRRQMDNLTTDNETLLNDIDAMEDKLKKVNLIGVEQKEHLELLELELNRLKERNCNNASSEQRLNVSLEENKALKKSLDEMIKKYNNVKEMNSQQRHKFNTLKDRFVDVYRKLKKLKDCKIVLLETQQEYADSVSKWQNEIIRASKQLCGRMNALQAENIEIQKKLTLKEDIGIKGTDVDNNINFMSIAKKLHELSNLTNDAIKEHKEKVRLVKEENEKIMSELETQKSENRCLAQELSDLKTKLRDNNEKNLYTIQVNQLNSEIEQLNRDKMELQHNLDLQKEKYENLKCEFELKVSPKTGSGVAETLNTELNNCRQEYEAVLGRFEMKEREHADLLNEMREINEALKARGDVISRQEEKQQELKAELKRNYTSLQQLQNSISDKDQSIELKNEEILKLKTELEALKAKMQELENIKKPSEEHKADITDELISLKQDSDDSKSDVIFISTNVSTDFEKKLQDQMAETDKLIKEKQVLQTELNGCKEKLKHLEQLKNTLQAENKKFKTSRKQANVLSLEIEAAEKSLTDVSSKLTAKTNELAELNAVLETKESTIKQLRKEIVILEASKSSEFEHGKELKAQIDRLQSQIKDAVHAKQTALDKSKDLEYAKERLQLELEDLRLQLAETTSKQNAIHSELRSENTQLNFKLQEMETALSTTQATLQTTKRSLEDMRVEYLEYKVKAQAVLRKNQSKDLTYERELEGELDLARSKSQHLEAHTQMLSIKLEEAEKELEVLRENNKSSIHRNEELQKLVEELRLQNDTLLQEQLHKMQAQQEALRQQCQQLQNVEICHKDKIETLERNYQRQIEQLKSELNKSARQPTIIGAVAKIPPIGQSPPHNSDLLLMEREDAEGSEEANAGLSVLAAKRKISNASSSRRSLHDLMPLDELLSAPLNELNSEMLLKTDIHAIDDATNANFITESDEHLQLLAAKERLNIQESRLRHLTALLAENEQDLAKLTQMNDMLKEELRRQERSVEREQHMHNSEYLKNVFIKFITLNSVDERTRLVPVLNTILKLSRNEMEMLNCVAKGQKAPDSNARSWSNFLPSWGGNGTSGN